MTNAHIQNLRDVLGRIDRANASSHRGGLKYMASMTSADELTISHGLTVALDEITALKLQLAEMTVARDEAVAIAESAATWLEANTDKSARRGVAKLVHAKLPRLRSVGKKAP